MFSSGPQCRASDCREGGPKFKPQTRLTLVWDNNCEINI